ncbi:MAG: hypothetical protein NZM29_05630, partial [Nitrospira sp.]|nr:hypothetical protein [Nitrospira sp.]
NTVIRNNRTRGGRAGLAVLKPCCPPSNVEFRDNLIREVDVPVVTAQDLSTGMLMASNVFCVRGPVDAAQRRAIPNNSILNILECDRELPVPQHLRIR